MCLVGGVCVVVVVVVCLCVVVAVLSLSAQQVQFLLSLSTLENTKKKSVMLLDLYHISVVIKHKDIT